MSQILEDLKNIKQLMTHNTLSTAVAIQNFLDTYTEQEIEEVHKGLYSTLDATYKRVNYMQLKASIDYTVENSPEQFTKAQLKEAYDALPNIIENNMADMRLQNAFLARMEGEHSDRQLQDNVPEYISRIIHAVEYDVDTEPLHQILNDIEYEPEDLEEEFIDIENERDPRSQEYINRLDADQQIKAKGHVDLEAPQPSSVLNNIVDYFYHIYMVTPNTKPLEPEIDLSDTSIDELTVENQKLITTFETFRSEILTASRHDTSLGEITHNMQISTAKLCSDISNPSAVPQNDKVKKDMYDNSSLIKQALNRYSDITPSVDVKDFKLNFKQLEQLSEISNGTGVFYDFSRATSVEAKAQVIEHERLNRESAGNAIKVSDFRDKVNNSREFRAFRQECRTGEISSMVAYAKSIGADDPQKATKDIDFNSKAYQDFRKTYTPPVKPTTEPTKPQQPLIR